MSKRDYSTDWDVGIIHDISAPEAISFIRENIINNLMIRIGQPNPSMQECCRQFTVVSHIASWIVWLHCLAKRLIFLDCLA